MTYDHYDQGGGVFSVSVHQGRRDPSFSTGNGTPLGHKDKRVKKGKKIYKPLPISHLRMGAFDQNSLVISGHNWT